MNQCSGCERHFGSPGAHSMHRTGKFQPKTPEEKRRCMTVDEMLAIGMRVVPNNKGLEIWRGPENPFFQQKRQEGSGNSEIEDQDDIVEEDIEETA